MEYAPHVWNQLWKEYADSATESPAQTYRRKIILSLLGQLSEKPTRLLDVGSGQGDFAAEVNRLMPGTEILGLEVSQSGIHVAQRKVPQATFIQQDLTVFREPSLLHRGWATVAVCSEVLEHLDEPQLLLQNIRPYLAPGCQLIVTVPCGPISEFERYIGHRRHYTQKTLSDLAEKSAYKMIRCVRPGFPFLNLYRFVLVARGKGLISDVAASSKGTMSRVAVWTMRTFDLLFKMNLSDSPWGWQLIAVMKSLSGS